MFSLKNYSLLQGNIDDLLDIAIERLIYLLLLFMPLAFGVVHAWSEEFFVLVVSIITICFVFKVLLCSSGRLYWTWAYVPLALFLLLSVFQLIPLPADLVRFVSPNTFRLRGELLSGISGAQGALREMPLSFYPYATKHDLRLLLCLFALFVVVVNVFRSSEQIERLLKVVACIGGGVAILALIQNLCGNGHFYWILPYKYGSFKSGPFLCHSHYAQFMNLSIGATIGWICVELKDVFNTKKVKVETVSEYLSSHDSRLLWMFMAMMGLSAATVFISLSRSGMVSLVFAVVITSIVIVSKRPIKAYGWVMVVMVLTAFVSIILTGFDAVYDRFATLGVFESYEGRLQIVKDLLPSFKAFPLLGSGLGSHRVVYPIFQSICSGSEFTHAENEYAQALEETGGVGLIALAVFGFIVFKAYFMNIQKTCTSIRCACYGLGFGLFAILFNSISDFGQHLPANSGLLIIFCALIVRLRDSDELSISTRKVSLNPMVRSSFKIVFIGGIFCVVVWAVVSSNNARIAQQYWDKAEAIEKTLMENQWDGESSEYNDLIKYAGLASCYEPGNVEYKYGLNNYRRQMLNKSCEGEYEQVECPLDIVKGFEEAVLVCPLFGPSYSMLGRIELLNKNPSASEENIIKGYFLMPNDPDTCFAAGVLELEKKRIEQSVEPFRKAIRLHSKFFNVVAKLYVKNYKRYDLAVELAGKNLYRLRYVRKLLAKEADDEGYSDYISMKMQVLLEDMCKIENPTTTNLVWLGDIYRNKSDSEKAIECYYKASNLDYGNVNLRYKLAKVLADSGEIERAMKEAKNCLRIKPQFKAAQDLIETLCVRPVKNDETRGDGQALKL